MDAAEHQPDLRTYLAAERTFLAWIRTGVACMGFGFVVARFGIFLHELQLARNVSSVRSYGPSLWLGIALVAAGVFMNVISAWHHARLVGQLNRGETPPSRPSTQAVTLALFLGMIGLGMAIYLISLQYAHGSTQSNSDSKENTFVTPMANNGIISKPTHHSVDETVEKLKSILQAKGITLFALIDHSGEAEKVGIKMKPTKLMIFGNPKAGTPLVLAAPSSAIDLPIKILVWEDPEGKVWVSYNSPAYLQERHGIPSELLQDITVVEGLAAKAAE
jgi:uncharacterized protein (DUF302 family)/uncharacterized membrane protein YidH (DUF202 family)